MMEVLKITSFYYFYMKSYRLSPEDRREFCRRLAIKTKPLGELLREADLVSPWQLESALEAKLQYPELKIGEILAQQKIIKSETADFFVQDWIKAVIEPQKNALGYYLQQAAILDPEQIEHVLAKQKTSGVRFGTVAVLQGYIKSTTLDFFLTNLYPEESERSPFVNMHSGSPLFLV